jgi:broad specificity phosphatase PhoE
MQKETEMKEIVLIRHARVDADMQTPIYASQIPEWLEMYDASPIDPQSTPPQETVQAVQEADILLTSTLPRTIASAERIGRPVFASDACFNEAAVARLKIPFVKLSPLSWLHVIRLLIFVGLGNSDTRFSASRARAKEAAAYLTELSKAHDRIALIGHGGMNWLITKALEREGWQPRGEPSHSNWGMTRLEKRH